MSVIELLRKISENRTIKIYSEGQTNTYQNKYDVDEYLYNLEVESFEVVPSSINITLDSKRNSIIKKYRAGTVITLNGVVANVYKYNHYKKALNYKDAAWLKNELHLNDIDAKNIDLEEFVINTIKEYLNDKIKASNIKICGNLLCFWNRENSEGYTDNEGNYNVNYNIMLSINGIPIKEEDLFLLCPDFN